MLKFTEFWYLWKLWSTGMSISTVDRILVVVKTTVRNVNSHCWQDFGSSESYSWQVCQFPLLTRFWELQKATLSTPIGMSTPTVERILIGQKAMITEWRRWRTNWRRKSHMWWTHISRSVVDPYVRTNNVIHCVAEPQVKKTKALNKS